jgi:integrase
MNELILSWLKHAKTYYRKPDGTPTSEVECYKMPLRVLKELYGSTPAGSFGPQEFKTVREAMIGKGWVRKSINRHLERIRRIFRWAGEQGIVAAEIYHRLRCVSGLKIGRSEARESDPVKPAPEAFVNAAKEHAAPPVRAMIDLQLLTAMRPGEVCAMRGCDLETGGKTWIFRPPSHKNEHHGHVREVYLGPKAQEVVEPFLKTNLEAYIFSPMEARQWQHQRMRQQRKSKVQPSQVNRKKARPKRTPGNRYDVHSYRRAIKYACRRANVPVWHPHQLRHNAATNLRKEYGIEMARIILGHSSIATSELYAEMDRTAAQEVIAKVG